MHDASGVLLSFTPFRDMSTLSENFRVVWWLSLPGKEDFQAFTFRLSENVWNWRLLLFGRVGKRRESDPGPCSLWKHHRWIYAGNLFSPFVACFFVVQPNMYDDQDSRKSDPKICKVQEHQRWMYGGGYQQNFALEILSPPLLIFSMLLRHPLCLFVCFVSHSQKISQPKLDDNQEWRKYVLSSS